MGLLKYFTLFVFLVSLLLIVYLQFNSGKSIDNLTNANARLINELKAQSELQKLEIEVIAVESNVRGAVIRERVERIKNLENRILSIRKSVSDINAYFNDSLTDSIVKKLDTLVERKIRFNYSVLNLVFKSDIESAEKLINTGIGRMITDSIVKNIDLLSTTRQTLVTSITATIVHNGRNARTRGMVLAVMAAIASLLAFWKIISVSRHQQNLIKILDASEKKVKESAMVKEQFLANMSHEIRTPMNAIIGFTNLLQKTPLNNIQKEQVNHIQSSGKNLLAIINDILDLSKIESGLLRIEKVPFNLTTLLHSIEGMFLEKARTKKIDFSVNSDIQIPEILVSDYFRLNQILINLLSNAIKFTNDGSVNLLVNVAARSENQLTLKFSVGDTGIGIPPADQKIIFDRFQQAEVSTTRKYGGSGLGLSIVNQLVKLLNGSISVTSEINKGSVFILELPFDLIQKDSNEMVEIPAAIAENKKSKNHKILVAEDHPVNQSLLKHILQHHEFEYSIVNNGFEAVDSLKTKQFDLVLMDIQMPEMDGYTTAGIIRNELGLSIPIIAISANAMPGEKEKSIRAGMNDYILKPIIEIELLGIINRYIENPPLQIDLAYLRELSNGDVEFEKKILAQFLLQVPKELKALELALLEGNNKDIKMLSHSLKSSVGYVGLSNQVLPLIESLENSCSKLSKQVLLQEFSKISAICNKAIYALTNNH